ncbi:MAG TPA: ester cyclase [Candidatus Angelobacter sp.]|nr:ester cyclase [Candidatus Angelobacter sp.]
MQVHRMFFLMVISCIGIFLAPEEQRKPAPTPPNNTGTAPVQQRKPVEPAQSRSSLPGQIQIAPAEQNKAVVRRVFDDLFSRGRYEFIDQIYAKDCPVHFGNRHTRLEQAVAEGKGWRTAAPDLLMTVERMEVERDFVIVDWIARGTNTGKGNGVPATGKKIVIRGNSRFRVADGKIVEVWNNFDRDEIFRQLGVPPKLGQLYDGTQDFLFALNQVFSSDKAGAAAQSN